MPDARDVPSSEISKLLLLKAFKVKGFVENHVRLLRFVIAYQQLKYPHGQLPMALYCIQLRTMASETEAPVYLSLPHHIRINNLSDE